MTHTSMADGPSLFIEQAVPGFVGARKMPALLHRRRLVVLTPHAFYLFHIPHKPQLFARLL